MVKLQKSQKSAKKLIHYDDEYCRNNKKSLQSTEQTSITTETRCLFFKKQRKVILDYRKVKLNKLTCTSTKQISQK